MSESVPLARPPVDLRQPQLNSVNVNNRTPACVEGCSWWHVPAGKAESRACSCFYAFPFIWWQGGQSILWNTMPFSIINWKTPRGWSLLPPEACGIRQRREWEYLVLCGIPAPGQESQLSAKQKTTKTTKETGRDKLCVRAILCIRSDTFSPPEIIQSLGYVAPRSCSWSRPLGTGLLVFPSLLEVRTTKNPRKLIFCYLKK